MTSLWFMLLLGYCSAASIKFDPEKTNVKLPKAINSFLIVGDYGHTSRSGAERIAAQMNNWAGANGADFILSLGDNFYQDGPSSVSDALFNTRWADVYTGSNIADLIWLQSVGNHDYYPYEGYEWNEVARTSLEGEEKWYLPHLWYDVTFDSPAGPIDIIVVDSQGARRNLNDARTVMYNWYENTMWLSDQQNHFKFVVSHHPSRAAGNYYPGSGTIQNNIEPQLYQYNADFFLNGHDHNLQHLKKSDGTGPEICIIGGGGAGLYSQDPAAASGLAAEGFSIVDFYRTYGFAGVKIYPDRVDIEFIDDNGSRLKTISRPARVAK